MAAILLAALAQTTLAAKPAGKSTHQVRQERPDRGAIRGAKPSITKAKAFLRGTIQPQAKPENTRTIVRSALNRTCRRSADRRRLRRHGPMLARGRRIYRRVAGCKHRFAMRSVSLFRRPRPRNGSAVLAPHHRMPRSDPDRLLGWYLARRRQCATGPHWSHQWHGVRAARDTDGAGRRMGKPVAVANGTSIKARR